MTKCSPLKHQVMLPPALSWLPAVAHSTQRFRGHTFVIIRFQLFFIRLPLFRTLNISSSAMGLTCQVGKHRMDAGGPMDQSMAPRKQHRKAVLSRHNASTYDAIMDVRGIAFHAGVASCRQA
jgi:hypothetical protein